jgi:FkbM family methyltransferase
LQLGFSLSLTILRCRFTIAAVDPSQISHTTLLGKALRLPLRLIPEGAVVRVVRGPARGKQWIASSSTHGFWLGYWELANQRRFAAHLRPGNVVYDVGAHVGLYTLLSSSAAGPEGHVYAFEPFARNLDYLRRHIALNRLSNCTVVDAAISDATTEQYFEPTEHDSAGHLSDSGSVRVRTVSLDDFVLGSETHRPPTVMKINAEGAEMEVFRGGRRTIAQFMPTIFLSTHSDEINRQCAEFLESLGYSLEHMAADKIWAERAGTVSHAHRQATGRAADG